MQPISDAVERALAAEGGLVEIAHAKINLALHVTGRRSDGYHNIETLAVFADYGDFVAGERLEAGRIGLAMEGPFADALAAGRLDENLVLRAAEALLARAPRRIGPTGIALTKRLPLEAGLGGGSADAAATLRLLNRMWELGFTGADLAAVGAPLGADVPMCVHARPLVASGIGERVSPVAGVPELPVVLAFPGGGLPTPAVFAALERTSRPGLPPIPQRFASVLDFVFWLRQTRNDLARSAAEVSSLAGAAARALARDPDSLFARMSGSGTSAFGIFVTPKAAERAAERIAASHPGWWVVPATTRGS